MRRGDDSSETTVEGPFTTRSGRLGSKSWHQNENGYTIVDVAEPSQVARPVAQSLTAPTPASARYVLSQTLSSGLTERTYYDAADFVVLRREYDRDGHVFRLDYSDFRTGPGGRRIAWQLHGADDRGNAYTAKLVSDAAAPVDDASLAIPPDRRTLVEFPSGIDEVHLPASVDGGRIHVTVNVNGYPLTFLLDSGASGIFINPKAAKELGLQSYGSSAMTVAGTFAFTRVIAPTVQVGSLTMHDVVMGTVPLDSWESEKDRVVGLLGYDFIAGTALRITYGVVDAIRPAVFVPPPLATTTMDVRLNGQVPEGHVGIGDASSDDFIVDTGAEAPIILFDRFVRAHPLAVADRGINSGGYDPDQSVVFGVGGRVKIVPLRLSSFRFADLDFKNFIVLRAENPGAFGDYRDDGLLGALFLRYFTLYIDYPHGKLYFEPNDNHKGALGRSVP